MMKLKKSVKAEEILQREDALLDRAKQRLAAVDNRSDIVFSIRILSN